MLYCKHTQAGVVEHVRDPALKVWTEAGQRALKASLSYSDTVGGVDTHTHTHTSVTYTVPWKLRNEYFNFLDIKHDGLGHL